MKIRKARFDQALRFIRSDIEREIALARINSHGQLNVPALPHGGGNFVAGLALLCYTEFAGQLEFGRTGKGSCSRNFNEFFDTLGSKYAALRNTHKVYDDLRCGLAHQYYTRQSCTIVMLRGRATTGVSVNGSHYTFNIEAYWHDLNNALKRLETKLFP